MVLGPENDRASCGELDAQPSPPDEGVMTFLRKKVKTGAVVGKRVLLQVNILNFEGLEARWNIKRMGLSCVVLKNGACFVQFVTDVKLAKSLYTTNYDQLYAYLSQHERHANEVRIMRERYLDPLTLVTNSPTLYNPSQSPQHSDSLMYPPQQFTPVYAAPIYHQHHHTLQGEDPIECINKAMAILSTVASRFPPSNNQLKTSSNLRNQATIQDGYAIDVESQNAGSQDTNSSAPNDLLVLSLVEQMTDQWRLNHIILDGSVIAKEHDVIFMIDDEETLILEEESRSKMFGKQNDPISIKQKINISPIDYSTLNKIKEYFGKRFVTQKELSVEQAFWLKHSNHNPDTSVKSHTPVRIEAPSELSKVVKKRTTSDVITADEITEVQTVFNQIEAAVDQCSVDKNAFEIQIKQLSIDNDKLLKQIMSQEIMHIVVNSVDSFDVKNSCVNDCNKCLELETELLKKKDLIEKNIYEKLLKIYSTLERHSQSQEKDTIIRKLKDMIKSLSRKDSLENVKKDIDEIETINIELEHSVAKLLLENENLRKEREHLKSIYKDQFDSIRKTRVQSKEHCDSLIAQINAKSVENSDLNAQLQEKVFAITALKNELRKLKGKNVVDTAVSKPNATIAPGMFKLDIEPISPRLKNNRDAHEVYIEKTIEYTDTLCGFVESARTQNPSEPLLESACMFTKHVQELFAEPITSLSNIPKQIDSLKTKDSNKPLLTSIGVKHTTSASGSKPSGNTKNNRISRRPSSNQKNKVEDHFRKVKSSLNKMNSISKPVSNALVKHFVRNAKFESICAICNKCLFDANHDMCIIDYVNVRSKYKSKRMTMRKVWKPMGKVFSEIGYSWKSTVVTPTLGILVYSRRLKATRSIGSSSKVKIIESKTSNSKEPKQSWESIVSDVPSSSLNDCSALCYPTNDGEDLGKLKLKADIGIFFGYAFAKKAFRIYNKRTRMIIETIHVDFDEFTAMASKQFSLGPRPKLLTHGTISSGLYLNPPPCVDPQVLVVITPEPAVSTGTPSSTIIDQDAPPTSTSQTPPAIPSLVIPLGVE
ncbi:hypothetical protein Tco_1042783 [Tanacetum coccineum]|uniref:Retroviral polymerase SH3-like domain-containing protein n=1 Tax=Tanacetum coccineum TaxID=301880 RepID=A0ABQ5GMQ4_9ASTR